MRQIKQKKNNNTEWHFLSWSISYKILRWKLNVHTFIICIVVSTISPVCVLQLCRHDIIFFFFSNTILHTLSLTCSNFFFFSWNTSFLLFVSHFQCLFIYKQNRNTFIVRASFHSSFLVWEKIKSINQLYFISKSLNKNFFRTVIMSLIVRLNAAIVHINNNSWQNIFSARGVVRFLMNIYIYVCVWQICL